jgi:uncharacterized phiE125 gp8 family phage protein
MWLQAFGSATTLIILTMKFHLVTAPTVEPLTTSEAKTHLRVTHAEDDGYIASLITAARIFVEKHTSRQLLEATWKMFLDKMPESGVIFIPKTPIKSITHVKYYDLDNVLQTMSSGNYISDIYGFPGRIQIDEIPSVYDRINAIEVQFVAGDSAAASVSQLVKQAMFMIIADMYENRNEEISGTITSKFEKGYKALLQFEDHSTI